MIGPVNNLVPGNLSTATVLGNCSLHAVKNTFSFLLLIHLKRV